MQYQLEPFMELDTKIRQAGRQPCLHNRSPVKTLHTKPWVSIPWQCSMSLITHHDWEDRFYSITQKRVLATFNKQLLIIPTAPHFEILYS